MIDKLFVHYSNIRKAVTVLEACEWELRYRESVKRTTTESISRLRSYMNSALPQSFLDSPIEKMEATQVCDLIQASIKNNHISYEAVKATLQILHAASKQAIAKKILISDPLIAVEAAAFKKDCSLYSAVSIKEREKLEKKADTDRTEDDIFEDTDEILSPEVIEYVREHLWKYAEKETAARALLLNTYMGLRIGETPVLMVRDIGKNLLHVHQSQVKHEKTDNKPQCFETVPWLKNECGASKGGRYVPLDLHPQIRPLLELCIKHAVNGFLFADDNGRPVTKDSLRTFLVRHMAMIQKELQKVYGEDFRLEKTNNHVFRKSLNTNVLIPQGYELTERSMMLGHSPRVNLENYTKENGYMYRSMVERAKSHLNDGERSLTGRSKPVFEGSKVLLFQIKERSLKAPV